MRASVPPTGPAPWPRDTSLPGPVATAIILASAALFVAGCLAAELRLAAWLLSFR